MFKYDFKNYAFIKGLYMTRLKFSDIIQFQLRKNLLFDRIRCPMLAYRIFRRCCCRCGRSQELCVICSESSISEVWDFVSFARQDIWVNYLKIVNKHYCVRRDSKFLKLHEVFWHYYLIRILFFEFLSHTPMSKQSQKNIVEL